MDFKFIDFNRRRAMRGAEAANVLVINDDGEDDMLWMSRADIGRNMIAFGRHPELVKAHDAYAAFSAAPLPSAQLRCEGCGGTMAEHDRLAHCPRPNG